MADAIDLVIDFATLGEYGLEPDAAPPACQSRRRPQAPPARRSTSNRSFATRG